MAPLQQIKHGRLQEVRTLNKPCLKARFELQNANVLVFHCKQKVAPHSR